MGLIKKSIGKFLIGYRFHVKLRTQWSCTTTQLTGLLCVRAALKVEDVRVVTTVAGALIETALGLQGTNPPTHLPGLGKWKQNKSGKSWKKWIKLKIKSSPTRPGQAQCAGVSLTWHCRGCVEVAFLCLLCECLLSHFGVNWPTTLCEHKDGVHFFTLNFECHNKQQV